MKILLGIKTGYENFHHIKIEENVLESVVELANQFLDGRKMPDKAIDLLDESCSIVAIRQTQKENRHDCVSNDSFDNISKMSLLQTLSLDDAKKTISFQSNEIFPKLSETDVKAAVSVMTGIPFVNSFSHATDKIKEKLEDKIFGQDEAIKKISAALLRNKIGLGNPNKPIGVFLFVGPSGVGKTELAKELAKALFHCRSSFIRYDMSEFSEPNSISKLIGSPPGYVGFDQSETLADKVFRHPYSIVLFDEIEKANKEVLNLLLQINDEGYMTDSTGKKVSFNHTCIIMTSNVVGGEKGAIKGFVPDSSSKEIDNNSLISSFFSDESLGRIDDCILFSPLDDNSLLHIAYRKIQELRFRAEKMGIILTIDDCSIKEIIRQNKKQGQGARPIVHAIEENITNLLAIGVADGSFMSGDKVYFSFDNGTPKILRAFAEKKKIKKDCLPTVPMG